MDYPRHKTFKTVLASISCILSFFFPPFPISFNSFRIWKMNSVRWIFCAAALLLSRLPDVGRSLVTFRHKIRLKQLRNVNGTSLVSLAVKRHGKSYSMHLQESRLWSGFLSILFIVFSACKISLCPGFEKPESAARRTLTENNRIL